MTTKENQILLSFRLDSAPVDTELATMCLLPTVPHGNNEGFVKAAWIPQETV